MFLYASVIRYVSSNKIIMFIEKLIKEKEKLRNRKINKKFKLADYEEVISDYFG